MVTKEQLLIEKLQVIYDRALATNIYKPFYIAVFEYVDNFDTNPLLEPVWKALVAEGEKEISKAVELEKQANDEMRKVYKQVKDYVEGNKITDTTVLGELNDFELIEKDLYHSSNGPTRSRHGALSYALMTLAEDTTSDHLPFVRKFGSVTDERRIQNWHFSPSYIKWDEEEHRLDRIKVTKTWYSWDQLFFLYQIYRDYEKVRDEMFEQRKFFNLAGLSEFFQELNDTKDHREDTKRYLRQFDVGTYKTHLQRLHSYTKEMLLSEVTPKGKSALSWEYKNGTLFINGKEAHFRQGFRRELIALLCKNPKTVKKLWEWDEVFEEIDGSEPDISKKNSFYEACKGLSENIASKTGITDFLVYDTNTVKVNPSYTN